ncbi:Proton-dependent oligopeptide transporter family [Sesbania bispinosa]|nr:Proton-dependent oligopeptide transporter family [Sesbania bispinosa]
MLWTIKGSQLTDPKLVVGLCAALVLGIEIVERLSTMGIAVNLIPSLADKTIGIFSAIQGLGTATLAISTKLPQLRPPPCHVTGSNSICKQPNGFQMGIFYVALYLIALGTGGLKSSVSGFGSDQFDEKDEKEKSQMAFFFNRYKKSMGSPIVHIFQVIAAAIRKRKMELPYDINSLYEDTPQGSRIEHTDQFRFYSKPMEAILITLAVYDRLIMPLWKKWNGKPGFTNLQRIGLGLILSTLGMGAAALGERKRLSVAKGVNGTMATLPIRMKTMSTGLFLTTLSLGFFVSSFLVSVVKKVTGTKHGQGWLADNINSGRLDLFYALLTILSFINLVAFVVCAIWYKPKKKSKSAMKMVAINGSFAEKC